MMSHSLELGVRNEKDTHTGFRFALSSFLFTVASSRATVGREPTSRTAASSSTSKSSSEESSSVENPYRWTFPSSAWACVPLTKILVLHHAQRETALSWFLPLFWLSLQQLRT